MIAGSDYPGCNQVQVLRIVAEGRGDVLHQNVFCLIIQDQRLLQVDRLIGFGCQSIKGLVAVAVALGEAGARPIDAQPVLGMRIVLDPTLA